MTTAWDIREGDVLDRLREMPDESVHCVVTSPPYWGLRDYGTAAWDGGDPDCGHTDSVETIERAAVAASTLGGGKANQANAESSRRHRDVCGRCGARRVDQQLGLERRPDCGLWAVPAEFREQTGTVACGQCYVCKMVEVFREVRRVLRSDGTCWVNMGDGYAASKPGAGSHGYKDPGWSSETSRKPPPGLKPKDLIGMPWRLAFALQADGWWLRSEIIWSKPNPMPESVTDRPTKAHEQIFLLTKRGTYYYDSDAIREAIKPESIERAKYAPSSYAETVHNIKGRRAANGVDYNPAGRNARSVWTIATQPYAEAHFATFPEELPRRCILAGTSERGVCPQCGAPWRRGTSGYESRGLEAGRRFGSETPGYTSIVTTTGWEPTCAHALEPTPKKQDGHGRRHAGFNARWDAAEAAGTIGKATTGWEPTCGCERSGNELWAAENNGALPPVPAVVLDPFAGSGTTLLVAVRHGRSALGIELNPEYAAMARRRILADHGAVEPTNGYTPAEGVQGRMAL